MRITTAWLREQRACPEQIEVFKKQWPEGASITEANLLRAAELNLNLGWLATQILSPSLLAEYRRQSAPFLEEYRRQIAPFLEEYERQKASFFADYRRKMALLWAEYDRQIAPLWEERQRQVALLLYQAWLKERRNENPF